MSTKTGEKPTDYKKKRVSQEDEKVQEELERLINEGHDALKDKLKGDDNE